MNIRYQVFVSSTYADLKEERAKVIQTIMELDCIPAGMEIFPAIDEEQFEFIKRVIDDCDYYILIIGGRYGSLSEDGISYTEKEYNYAIEKNIRVIAFIHSNPEEIPFGKSEKDGKLREKLEAFKAKVSTNRLIKFWNKADELPGLVSLSLSKTIKTYPAIGWTRTNTIADPALYLEINELRKENQELREKNYRNELSTKVTYENIAGMENLITVTGTHGKWSSYQKRELSTDWVASISWNQIFGFLSPYLLDHPNDDRAKSILSESIYRTLPDAIEGGNAKINDQDFQTIKIQFKVLGLTEVNYVKTVQGGMGLFWYLTEKGEKLMLELRSVKK